MSLNHEEEKHMNAGRLATSVGLLVKSDKMKLDPIYI